MLIFRYVLLIFRYVPLIFRYVPPPRVHLGRGLPAEAHLCVRAYSGTQVLGGPGIRGPAYPLDCWV